MLKCGSCVWLRTLPRLYKGKHVYCYDLGFHDENRACRNWRADFSKLRKKSRFSWFLRSLGKLKLRDLDIVEQLIKQQRDLIKKKAPYKIGSLVCYYFMNRWFVIFVEGIISIDGVAYIQGRSVDGNTTFTVPCTSVRLRKKLRVKVKKDIKIKVKLKDDRRKKHDKRGTAGKMDFGGIST